MRANLISLFVFFALLLSSLSVAHSAVVVGQINELYLQNPIQAKASAISVADGYEYFADNATLIINVFDDSLIGKKLKIDNLAEYIIAKTPSEWLFYGEGRNYAENSVAMPIHKLQASLPECILGNVCAIDGDFSIRLSNVTKDNSGKVSFFINNTDVTMLFYYDALDNLFKVKNYYQGQFFAHFTADDNFFSWESPSESGKLRIIVPNKRISGRFVDDKGKVPAYLKGKKVILQHNGSERLVPHKFEVELDDRGRYIAEGLPALGYQVYIPTLAAELRIDSISRFDNVTELSLTHTISSAERILMPPAEDRGYVQFGMFNSEGYFARTNITGLPPDGLLSDNSSIKATVNAVVPITKDNFKVHLYNADGNAIDVTSLFTWNNGQQSATLNRASSRRLYELASDESLLAATFCDSTMPDRCFRIKKPLHKGKNIEITDNTVVLGDHAVILRENDYRDIDLNALIPDLEAAEVVVQGKLPATYQLYNDGTMSILSDDIIGNFRSTMLINSANTVYQLPIFYDGRGNPIITEEGMDYTMCPEARPLCGNAFVSLTGVNRNIYNGKIPLRMKFPMPLKSAKVLLEGNSDITAMFNVQRRAIILRKEFIPAFLSILSNSNKPIMLLINDKRYHLSLKAGYKSLEVAVADVDGEPNPLLNKLKVRVACEDSNGYYAQVASIDKNSIAHFSDLPDCAYSMTLIDDNRIFEGYSDGVRVSAGQNSLHTRLSAVCVGGDSQYIENCQPIVPIINRRLIAPDFGVFFAENLDNVSVSEGLEYKVLGEGITLFALKSAPNSELRFDNYTVPLEVNDLSDYLVKTIASPEGKPGAVHVGGVTPSFVLLDDEPVVFNFETPFEYEKYSAKVTLNGADLSDMFEWRGRSTLTLRDSRYNDLVALFSNRQQTVYIELTADAQNSYNFSVVLGVGASDIVVQAKICEDLPEMHSARALLIGRRAKNEYEYRQLADVSPDGRFRFANVPLGVYDIVVFDQTDDLFGSIEIDVQTTESDLYIELPIKRLLP